MNNTYTIVFGIEIDDVCSYYEINDIYRISNAMELFIWFTQQDNFCSASLFHVDDILMDTFYNELAWGSVSIPVL